MASWDTSCGAAAPAVHTNAPAKTGLLDRAKTNTTGMLTGMLRGLGYQNVTVKFVEPAAP